MALPTTYFAGTATVNQGSTTAVGHGTAWLTAGLQTGDVFWMDGLSVRLASVESNTQLTFAYGWPGATRAAGQYEVRYTPDGIRALATSIAVNNALSNGNLYSFGQLQTAADKGLHFTGAGTAALHKQTEFARSLMGAADNSVFRAAIGGVPTGDTTNSIGFVGGTASAPYMRHTTSDAIILLQRLIGKGTGYTYIDGRLLVFGKAAGTPDSSGRLTVTLPFSFSNADWTPIVSNGNFDIPAVMGVQSISAHQIVVKALNINGDPYSSIYQVNYFGIGEAP
jgi:hypothetical protein